MSWSFPHMPMDREDRPDLIYKTQKEKYDAAIKEIIRLHKKGPAGSGGNHFH